MRPRNYRNRSIGEHFWKPLQQEFEGMIFKEESILLMILLESLPRGWLASTEESDTYGYAIILPSEKWVPKRVDF